MPLVKGEPIVGDIKSLHIECGDCGRERWLTQQDVLRRAGVSETTALRGYMDRLVCADCRSEGQPGRNLIASPQFYDRKAEQRAQVWLTNIQAALPTG